MATSIHIQRRVQHAHAAMLAALALPLLATDQQPEPAAPQRVEIRSETSGERRADTAGRQVVARQGLLRHGDTRLVDALQRVPGVSVDSRGQGSGLKLGGLGAGYTPVLLNGEPLPPGTALDSIERVDITRGSSVQSAQAIAGSINLVTRRASAVAARDYKLGAASQSGRPQASAAVNLSGKQDLATWGLGVMLGGEKQRWPATSLQERSDGSAEDLALVGHPTRRQRRGRPEVRARR